MDVWHSTPDAGREPRRVTPGSIVRLRIGTRPVEPGQAVSVEFLVKTGAGSTSGGLVPARWVENRGERSYWTAALGPFGDGDYVTYRVGGTAPGEAVASGWASFAVRPAIYLALLWHHHQPLYRDRETAAGHSYRFPWVRLHAIRDYYGMAALVAQHPEVHLTFNLSGVLLDQLESYLERGATDRALCLTRTPADRLTPGEQEEVLETFFDADWHHQIYPHARYRELLERRVRGWPFSSQDITDLQMWFNLAWFAAEFRGGEVPLPGGTSASVQKFVEQGKGFDQDDIEAMVEEQRKVMGGIVPLHRMLETRGQIEVSASPYYHPILPLIVDSDRATLDRPGTSLPPRFAHPEDAEAQIAAAVTAHERRFGCAPRGMWPAEGAVSETVLPLFRRHGIRWIATDEGVLARSGRHGYRVEDPGVLCQPYRALDAETGGELTVLFRHRGLSDAIGFHYQGFAHPEDAARAFVAEVKQLAGRLRCERDYFVPVIPDGENAWGAYAEDGRPFLHALYDALAQDAEIKTVTMSEYVEGNPARHVPPHPPAEQARVYELFTGSWIDEPGSAPGVDLGTWIGEPEENAAWALLGEVRRRLEAGGADAASAPEAFEALYAAEGSDWFWWLGTDHESDADEALDDLFRGHLKAACDLAGVAPPGDLARHMVPHRVVWTFTAPAGEIQAGDGLIVRTNCPGLLAWSTDGWRTVTYSRLNPCGGVMAGWGRHAVALGPFAGGNTLVFRFHCECQAGACSEGAPCGSVDQGTVKVIQGA